MSRTDTRALQEAAVQGALPAPARDFQERFQAVQGQDAREQVCVELAGACRASFEKGDLELALALSGVLMNAHAAMGDVVGLARATINRGNIQLTRNQPVEALRDYLAADDYLKGSIESRLICYNLINISHVYIQQEDYQRCIEFSQRLMDDPSLQSDPYLFGVAHLNFGYAHLRIGDLATALLHNKAAYRSARESGETTTLLSALDNLAAIYEQRGRWPLALTLQRRILTDARATQDAEVELTALTHIGRLTAEHLAAGDALAPLHQALELAVRAGRLKQLRDVHLALSAAYRRLERPDLALEHFERYHALEREVFNEDRERTVRSLTVQFDLERARSDAQVEGQRRADAERAQAEAEALVRARTAQLETAQREIASKLAQAAEFRDDTTGDHTWRVGMVSGLIAQELGLQDAQVETLRIAARLHDVGKIGIPDAILLKAGPLTEEEFQTMQAHTLIGARLLAGGHSTVLATAETITLSHHERWDGRGYPRGLRGEDIPLVGRIVAVADVFDALLQRRPYKRSWSRAEALAELERERGRHFDPAVLDAALRVFARPEFESVLTPERP